jgi:sodium-dependent phosphate transporter
VQGAGVADTIRSKIANLDYYKQKPDLYMYGMLCALLATGIWLILATYLELPVSTTHSIVGSVIGMSMIAAGADSGEQACLHFLLHSEHASA